MGTTRPLMRLGIGDLEDVFERQGKNFATLSHLKQELSHRQVPRAIALLERVQKAEAALRAIDAHKIDVQAPRSTLRLTPSTPETAPAQAPAQETPQQPVPKPVLQVESAQQDLLAGFGQFSPGASSKEPLNGAAPETTAPKKPATAAHEAIPQLALEDAYRILKVAADEAWERVESARRKAVLKSSPLVICNMHADQAQKLVAEARLANDAAIVIAARRSGRQ